MKDNRFKLSTFLWRGLGRGILLPLVPCSLPQMLLLLALVCSLQVRASLYIVGSAISSGWNRQEMTEQTEGVYTWQGYLYHGGELKFMTDATGWGSHWGPSAAGALLGMGTQKVALHTSGDYKYRVDNVGLCQVTVDVKAKQILVTGSDGELPAQRRYPPCLYPVGTAVSTELSEGNDYALHEDAADAGTYSGVLRLASGTLALHSRPYRKAVPVRTVTPVLASGATVKLPKLRYSMETDRCSYAPGDTVRFTFSATPTSSMRVRYRYLGDVVADTLLPARTWAWVPPADDFRGYMAEVYRSDEEGEHICATIGVDVSSDWTRFPRYGFVATFGNDKTLSRAKTEMKWLNRCHINGVQFQDWHYSHDWPLGGTREQGLWTTYKDVANRTIYTSAIRNYIRAQHERGMKSIFYNLCFGALDGWEERGVKPEWFIYKDRNHNTMDSHELPDTWKSDIYLLNPANEEWLSYLAERNDEVYSFLDFDGYQIDQLGARGNVYDYNGASVSLPDGYSAFISYMKNRHPDKRLVMNAVSQWGVDQIAATGKVDLLYSEVWGNQAGSSLTGGEGRFSNIKKVIDGNLSCNPVLRSVLAAYMNYASDNRNFNTPGVVMADAVMFALGGSHLELGGDHMLCREYFPYSGMKWHSQIEDWMTRYYDFMTAYENLLRDKWTEKANVRATCPDVTVNNWEPVAGQVTLVAREVNGRQVVHLLNFTHEEGAADVDADYMLCWHDNQAVRPWPKRFENLSLRLTGLTGMGKVRRIWVASPDYCGGAMQEVTDYSYSSAGGTVTLTLPSLQFWTMIVIEPETATTRDNVSYAPATDGEVLELGTASALEAGSVTGNMWSLLTEEEVFTAHVDLPAGTLTLRRDDEDAVVLPFSTQPGDIFYTPSGLPATRHSRGILLSKDKKVYFQSE